MGIRTWKRSREAIDRELRHYSALLRKAYDNQGATAILWKRINELLDERLS